MYAITPHVPHRPPWRCLHTCRVVHPTSYARVSTTPNLTVVQPHVPTPPPTPKPAANDPTLRSTWSHRAWVTAGCTTVLVSLARSITCAAESSTLLEPLLAALLGYVLADLGTGVYHWAIDNYGGPSTPVFGPQIEAFQGHHRWPWTITKRQFANNLHGLARAVTFVVVPIEAAAGGGDAAMHAFVGVCGGCIMMSQQFHAWAHGTRSRLPGWVVALQEWGCWCRRGSTRPTTARNLEDSKPKNSN